MSKWDKVHAILDKALAAEMKKYRDRVLEAVKGGKSYSAAVRHVEGNGHAKTISAKRKKPVSKQRALHGRYLGLTRTLPKEQKAKLSALYREKGVRHAIAEAKRMRASA